MSTKTPWYEVDAEIDAARMMIERYRVSGDYSDYRTANVLHRYADELTRRFTAFRGIESMIDAQDHGYRPTLSQPIAAVELLADLYDLICEKRKLPLRAHRGAAAADTYTEGE